MKGFVVGLLGYLGSLLVLSALCLGALDLLTMTRVPLFVWQLVSNTLRLLLGLDPLY